MLSILEKLDSKNFAVELHDIRKAAEDAENMDNAVKEMKVKLEKVEMKKGKFKKWKEKLFT